MLINYRRLKIIETHQVYLNILKLGKSDPYISNLPDYIVYLMDKPGIVHTKIFHFLSIEKYSQGVKSNLKRQHW